MVIKKTPVGDVVTVNEVLNFLSESKWSTLVDARYERDITKYIVNAFPDITQEVLDEILETIIY